VIDAHSFDRGWERGRRHGARSQAVAIYHEQRLARLVRALDLHRGEARMLLEQARHDAAHEHPDLPQHEQRAIAAQRLTSLILRQLLDRALESTA